MPSVAKGVTLDLALAGSKVGIVDSALGGSLHSRKSHQQHTPAAQYGSLVYNYKKYEKAGVLDPALLLRDHCRRADGLLLTHDGPADPAPLPRIRYQAGRTAPGSAAPPDPAQEVHHYSNRQRVLLEQDSRTSDTIHHKSEYVSSEDLSERRVGAGLHGLGQDEQVATSHVKAGFHRPYSSQLDQGGSGRSPGAVVQRHSSESVIRQSPGLYPASPTTAHKSHSEHSQLTEVRSHDATGSYDATRSHDATLRWTVSPPDTHQKDLPARPASPSPSDSPSPRLAEGAVNRDYIDVVAQENEVIKRQVQRSLKQLLKRAVWSAGSVTKAEVNALQEQLNQPSSERRESVNSHDSGISSDSVTRHLQETEMGSLLTPLITSTTISNAMEAANKPQRKKLSANKLRKHKSRSSAKRSRLKARPDSEKKVSAADPAPTAGNLLHLQAYCHTMQVLPASLRPKPDRPQLAVPPLPVRASTTAIYKERLPRVPAPTLTCDGSALRDAAPNMAAVTYPGPGRRSVTLNVMRVSDQQGTARRSYPEPGRVYAGGVLSEEPPRLTKVYQSERQSAMLSELGVDLPCAPPATPMPEVLKKLEYIPSMHDIRAQRAVKAKLEVLDRQEKKKKEKQQEQQVKKDKVAQREQVRDNKRQQRLQIYALNKVMTMLENENYLNFCSINGIEADL